MQLLSLDIDGPIKKGIQAKTKSGIYISKFKLNLILKCFIGD